MKKTSWKLIALVLTIALMLSGCSMVTIDKELDDAEVVAVVAGEKITKGEARETYVYLTNVYAQYAQYYNQSVSDEDVRNSAIDALVRNLLLKQKVAEMKIELTDEERAKIDEDAKTYHEELIEQNKSNVESEGKSDEEIRAAVEKYLADQGYNYDEYIKSQQDVALQDKLREQVVADVKATDEEITAKYDELVKADEESYASDTYQFEYNEATGTLVTWIPEGYRTVKHILLKLTDEQKTELSALEDELADVQEQLDNLANPEAEPTEAPTPEADATQAPVLTEEELNTKKADVETRLATKRQEVMASFQTKIDEINAKIAEGASFDTLIEEFGEDPGMKSEPGKTTGYFVSANSALWDDAFTKAAMALAKVGDISEPVLGSNGMHIIRYEADVASGAVALDSIRDKVEEKVVTELQDTKYDETYNTWLEEAKVERYPERLG